MSKRRASSSAPKRGQPTALSPELAVEIVRHLAPQLWNAPDALAALVSEVQKAESIAEARGIAPPSGRSYATKGRPTDATPLAAGFGFWGLTGKDTPQPVPNANVMRNFADRNPIVSAAINIRAKQIGRADIAVLPADERKPFDKKVQKAVTRLLDMPNEYKDSFRTTLEPVIRDILTIDRGCISKDLDLGGRPTRIYAEDGATIRIFPDWDGAPKSYRYLYVPPGQSGQGVGLTNDQLICIMDNQATWRYGMAPVQILYDTIDASLTAMKSAKNLVSNKPPPHLIHFPSATQSTIDSLRQRLKEDILGQENLMFTGNTDAPSVFNLAFSLKDSQWLEWQIWLARLICMVFQVTPQQIGISFDVNRSTAEVQEEEFQDTGLIPLLLLLEEYLNRELLYDFAPKARDGRPDMEKLNLRIVFPMVSEAERILHYEATIKALAAGQPGLPILLPNEIRRVLGEEPFDHGGNTLWMPSKDGPIPWLSYDNDYGDYYNNLLTSGALGAQDPANGPMDPDLAEDDGPIAESGDSNPAAPDMPMQDDTPAGAGNGASPMPVQGNETVSTAPPTATQTGYAPRYVRRTDIRQPGKHWRPDHSVTYTPPVQRKVTRQGTVAPARAQLQRRAEAIFAEVGKKRRGTG